MKVAILLAGPFRYLDLVIERLDQIAENKDINIDYYCFIWSYDNGNKKREIDNENWEFVENHPNMKTIIRSAPFDNDDYSKYINPNNVEGNQSFLSNIMGMFYSVSSLLEIVKRSPLNYDFVMRLRTDCLIVKDDFFSPLFEKDINKKIIVSKNYLIKHSWISDHITIGSLENMIKIWSYDDKIEFYKTYKKIGLNPEKYLAHIATRKRLHIIESWIRFKDYLIIYTPPKAEDPELLKNIISEKGVNYLFKNVNSIYKNSLFINEINQHSDTLKINLDNSSQILPLKILRKLKENLNDISRWQINFK
jgi:hypothetical protein